MIPAPTLNRATILRRNEFISSLQKRVPNGRVIGAEQDRRVYAGDAFMPYRAVPLAVVLPSSVREVSDVLRFCYEQGIKVYPRGAGTSLVGGAVGSEDGIVLCVSRMNSVLEIDTFDRLVSVQAGVTNDEVARAAVAKGLCYMPDPASRSASTIGGNIATDAGGARAARLGATGRHVLALKVVLIDGEVIDIGGGELEHAGLNVQALFSGGEGLIGVVVEATLRLMPPPAGIRLMLLGFPSMSGALSCAGAMSDAGITPRALELIDRQTAKVCEQFMPAGLPLEPEVLLAVEFEGESDELAEQSAAILRLADGYGTSQWLEITGPDEIARTWQSWGAALTALARLGPLRSTDIAVPPARLPSALAQIGEIAARYGLRGANLCRAGDGIIQSVLFYEPDDGDEEEGRVAAAMAEIAKTATEVGGAISAEHGIGVAKREMLELSFRPSDMALQSRLKSAFDPEWLLNHGKVFPLAEQTAAVAQPVQFGREQG